jgi:phospholipase C
MNFYNQEEIPFYYDLAEKFAIDDRYFASVLGPTFPNRSYVLAATSFGHLTTSDTLPPLAATNQSLERSSTYWTRTRSLGATI